MILYHGSNIIIDVIDLTKSKRYKDFDKFSFTFQYAFCTQKAVDQLIKL